MDNTINTKEIPSYIKKSSALLLDNGFKAYLVGGAVRDLIIGRIPKDFDIATDATPDQMKTIFPTAVTTGAKFGNILLITEDDKGEKVDLDITTFREEENYFGGRWPNKVKFTSNIEEDLSRRDFTINALALNLKDLTSKNTLDFNNIIDPFNGLSDIDTKTIRAVRDPIERLKEDGLRSFKACRLASELEFQIEKNTLKAIYKTRSIANQVSIERITQELRKLIKYSPKPSVGINYMEETGLLKIIIPELSLTKDIVQPEWHKFDLYTHSLRCMDMAEDSIKYAALLHDIGKIKTITNTNGSIHFYQHDIIGSLMAQNLLTRLRFDKKEINEIATLIKWHMFNFTLEDSPSAITDKGIKNFVIKVGGIETVNKLIKLRIADGSSTGGEFNKSEILELQERITHVLNQSNIITTKELEVRGTDLVNIGYPEGEVIGKILNRLLELVNIEGEQNNYHSLVAIAKKEFPLIN